MIDGERVRCSRFRPRCMAAPSWLASRRRRYPRPLIDYGGSRTTHASVIASPPLVGRFQPRFRPAVRKSEERSNPVRTSLLSIRSTMQSISALHGTPQPATTGRSIPWPRDGPLWRALPIQSGRPPDALLPALFRPISTPHHRGGRQRRGSCQRQGRRSITSSTTSSEKAASSSGNIYRRGFFRCCRLCSSSLCMAWCLGVPLIDNGAGHGAGQWRWW